MREGLGLFVTATALCLASPARGGDLSAEQTAKAPGGWTAKASADFVYATRDGGDNYIILQDTVTGDTLLNSDQLSFGWEPGLDARLDFTDGKYGGGVRFFGAFEFEGNKTITTPPIWNFPTNPPLFGLGTAAFATHYDSSLDSVELNLSRAFGPRANVFVGVRGIMLDETLRSVADFGTVKAVVSFDADTAAIGPQIGGELHFGDRVFVDLDGRVGALRSQSDLAMSVTQDVGPAFAASGDHSDWIAAVEGGIAAGIKLCPTTSLRAGYRVLYLNSLPTAPSIVAETDVIEARIKEQSSDDIIIHGVTVGLEIAY